MSHPKALQAMKNLGLDHDEYKSFIIELKSAIAELLVEAIAGINNNDHKATATALHSIKGSVGSLGLTDTHIKCQTIEAEFKKSMPINAMVLINDFTAVYDLEFNEVLTTL